MTTFDYQVVHYLIFKKKMAKNGLFQVFLLFNILMSFLRENPLFQ